MDIQERLTAFAMLGATWVMWLLVGISVIALAIVLERAYFFFATNDEFSRLLGALLGKLKENDVDGAKSAMRASRSVEAQVALAGLESVEDGPSSAEERMNKQQTLSKLSMERNLAFLGTVGNNAPFVGLLGTVIGIIRAFQELNQSQGQVSAGLMAEIGEALVATAIGLGAYISFLRFNTPPATRADALGREVLAFMKSKKRDAAPAE
jgi:biopolymer transport protein ExbB